MSKKATCVCLLTLVSATVQAQMMISVGETNSSSQAPQTTASYQVYFDYPAEATMHLDGWLSTYDWTEDFDRLYIYNDENAAIGWNQFASASDPFLFHMFQGNQGMVFRVGEAGTYTIAVHAGQTNNWGSATGEHYTLSVSAKYCNDTNEVNDTLATAAPITLGDTVTAYEWRRTNTMAIGGDEDWYQIMIPCPGQLRIDLSDWVGVFDWTTDFDRLYVYAADEVSIGNRNSTGCYDWMMSNDASGSPHIIEMNLTHEGYYYLGFHAGTGWSTTPYHFVTSFTKADDPFEPNNSFAEAKPIPASDVWYQAYEWNTVGNTMDITGDEDYYYFIAAAAGQYAITLNGWIGIYDWGTDYDYMGLFDASQKAVGPTPISWMMGSGTPITFNIPGAGKYYIHLHCGAAASLNGYMFKLTGATLTQPTLKTIMQPDNGMRIGWTGTNQFTLQQSAGVTGTWSPVKEQVQVDGNANYVAIPATGNSMFYRLVR